MIQKCRSVVTALCVSIFIVPVAIAQEPNPTAEPVAPASTRAIEEITIFGERTINTLRFEIEAAEIEVFGIFNDLNSSDEFDITCTREVFIGSYFRQRTCMAAYLRKAQAQSTSDVLRGIDVPLNLNSIKQEVHQKTVALDAEMRRLAQENQEFFEALLKLTELQRINQTMKAKNPIDFGQ